MPKKELSHDTDRTAPQGNLEIVCPEIETETSDQEYKEAIDKDRGEQTDRQSLNNKGLEARRMLLDGHHQELVWLLPNNRPL